MVAITRITHRSTNRGRLGDGVDEDADAVGPEVHGDRGAEGHRHDMGIRHVLEDDLLRLLGGKAHHLALAAAAARFHDTGAVAHVQTASSWRAEQDCYSLVNLHI
jgi:hypothetical protein